MFTNKYINYIKRTTVTVSTKSKSLNENKKKWTSVIGLEVHAQIKSNSKMFSGAETTYGAPVNNQVAFFDAALPGTLPVLNRRCVEAGIMIASVFGSKINLVSFFDRKHYFYPDLPSGYQITQQRRPLAIGGYLNYPIVHPSYKKPISKIARIIQVQLEHDSGKMVEDISNDVHRNLIDLNRSGLGLIEIVTQPDFGSSEEATSFVKELQLILKTIDVSLAKMEEGSLRVDASISVNPSDSTKLGTRTEIKNVNSLRSLSKSIDYEIKRQIEVLETGGCVKNVTMFYDNQLDQTVAMRDKESIHDYRFMDEPNLPPLRLNTSDLASMKALVFDTSVIKVCSVRNNNLFKDEETSTKSLTDSNTIQDDQIEENINVEKIIGCTPELPEEKRQRLMNHGLTLNQSIVLVSIPSLLNCWEECVIKKHDSIDIKNKEQSDKSRILLAANFLINQVLGVTNKRNIDFEESNLKSKEINEIIDMLHEKYISLSTATKILDELLDMSGCGLTEECDMSKKNQGLLNIRVLVEKNEWFQINDSKFIEKICLRVLEQNAKAVKDYKAGNTKIFGFLIGQVFKEADGRTDGKQTKIIFEKLLDDLK